MAFTVTDAASLRRLDSDEDLLRRELVAARDRRTIIIPVLVSGADPLEAATLPDELRGLEQLQALDLSARHWDADVALLIDRIGEVLAQQSPPVTAPEN